MAYDFVAANSAEIYGDISSFLNSKQKTTIAGWVNRESSASLQAMGFNAASGNAYLWEWAADNKIYALINGSFPSVAKNTTGWHHIVFMFDGSQAVNANKHILYYDGSAQTLSGTATSATTVNAALGNFRLGRRSVPNTYTTGQFAEVGVWDALLTADEIASLAKGFSPYRINPHALVTVLKIVRNVSDISSGTAFTNSSATVADHPRVY